MLMLWQLRNHLVNTTDWATKPTQILTTSPLVRAVSVSGLF
jgi:hypothetical protein